MFLNEKTLIPTIIITQEIQTELRGYSLVGREFVLKEPHPRKTEVIALDGTKVQGEFFVVNKKEYMRVVPEAQKQDFAGEEVFIPTWIAKRSFRPCYISI